MCTAPPTVRSRCSTTGASNAAPKAEGETRAHTLAQLKALDIGHGYTADGGHSFPFRGEGVGLLPSLREVLHAFPQQRFMLDQKDRSQATTDTMIAVLQSENALGRACLSGTTSRTRLSVRRWVRRLAPSPPATV
jgi:hypothetical protein